MVFDRIAQRIPIRLARTVSIAGMVTGLIGAALVGFAAAFGDWWLLAGAGAAALVAGSLWQVADRLSPDRH
jgi:hypothetical protein